MNVLIIAPRYHINLHDRVKALKRAGHRVSMLVQHRGVSENHSELEPCEIGYSSAYRLALWLARKLSAPIPRNVHLRFGLPPLASIPRAIRRLTPDLILIKGLGNALGVSALLAARCLGVDTIVLMQRERFGSGEGVPALSWLLFDLLGVRAVVSPIRDRDCVGRAGTDPRRHPRFHYLPFVYDVEEFDRSYCDGGVVQVLNVGKYLPSKDAITLLEAVDRIRSRHRLHVELIGERSDEATVDRLERYVREHGLALQVTMRFDEPHDAVLRAYRRADLFVLTSRREPASLQVLEAMANRLPVISSDGNGTCCYVEPGHSGLLFEAGNAADLAARIEQLISDPELIEAMGRRGLELARAEHDPARFAREIARLAGH